MITFFKVILHCLYFAAVFGIEALLWTWLEPNIGIGPTIVILIVAFIVLMMAYAAIFWKWRPSGGDGDFFSDIGDFGDFS